MEFNTSPDSQKISFKIIEAIKQHPALYLTDVKGIDVKLQDFRQKVWKFIADDLGLDVTWMKVRWKNLRDTYCRIVKYKHKPDKGLRRKKWIYEDHLSFLKFPFEPNYQQQSCEVTEEYLQLINNNIITSEGLLEQLEDKPDEDYSEFLEVVQKPQPSTSKEIPRKRTVETIASQAESNKVVNTNLLAQQIASKFRKIRPKGGEVHITQSVIQTSSFKPGVLPVVNETPIIISSAVEPPKKKIKSTNKVQQNLINNRTKVKNSLELFFDSMAKTMKKFPEDFQMEIKFNICKVIAEAELNSRKEKTVKKTDPIHTLPKLLLIPCHMIDKVK